MAPKTENAQNAFHPESYLDTVGALEDSKISLAMTVLVISAVQNQKESLDQYTHHLDKISESVSQRYHEFLSKGAADDAGTRLASLKHVLAGQENYVGDEDDYRNIDSFDILRTIDRRSGAPIILSILYMHVAREQGWITYGINFPCHFLFRLDHEDTRLLVDVAGGCRLLQASDLRSMIKEYLGESAELSAHYYEPLDNRGVIIDLYNHIKSHQIVCEDYQAALSTVQLMRRVAPQEHRLFFDAGILYAKTGQAQPAISALEQYIEQEPSGKDRQDAVMLLRQIQEEM